MTAPKKDPAASETGHAEQTRKVDGMSELVAGLLLAHPDGAPPDPTPGSASAVRPSAPRQPSVHAIEERAPGTRVLRAVVIGLVIAIGLVAVVAALLVVSR
jgi:hypothetical protein